MRENAKAVVLLSFTMLVNFVHLSAALRGALARVGRSWKFDDDVFRVVTPPGEPPYPMFFQHNPRQLERFRLLLSSAGQTKLHRFGRSLYGVDGSSASAIMRSQRGLQSPEEQRSVIVIDADDGQLMRYGKR
ncbi:hypothetical protein niasHT_007635 [Heterodera trifolii]|uniref:Uncharacterized protein n=1 Tax=Heterodera trifolii TaxID=157864 RepID=A0ABD2LPR6_9BILA